MSASTHTTVVDPTSVVPSPSVSTKNPDIAPSAIAANLTPALPDSVEAEFPNRPGVSIPVVPSSSAAVVTTAPAAPISATGKGSSKSKKKKSQVTVTMATAATAQSSNQGSQGENTGRWTAEEHRLFLQGLDQHGKGWKKIASLIKSRTVVQIRTHAQKYFQKLAKARQNGEEGDVAMEGRGGAAALPSVSASAAQSSKRRRQTSGTKRKAIQSVVSSAQRQGKKMATEGVPNPTAPIPAVAPSLSPYVLPPSTAPHAEATESCVPSITTAQGTITGPALEDSLFRFLTPAPVEPQVTEVARQAGAHPITLPADQPRTSHAVACGEVSPTAVADLTMYPSWTDAKDTPSWYAKGSDVDALLDVADTLDWLTDTGDLNEAYQPTHPTLDTAPSVPETTDKPNPGLATTPSAHNMSLNTLPRVDSSADVVVPPLPSLFDGGATDTEDASKKLVTSQLPEPAISATIDQHLQVFDTPLEEHDFVSTILENTGESSNSLPVLG